MGEEIRQLKVGGEVEGRKYTINHPSRIGTVVGMTVIVACSIIQLRLLGYRSGFGANLIYALYAVGIMLCIVIAVLALYRTNKKATVLCIDDDRLVLNEHAIQAKAIKRIMIKGYFKPIIGILPHGHRVVPMNLTFRYMEDEDKGISDLKKWSAMNNVTMGYQTFRNWI